MFYVYQIINLINGKIYIGQSQSKYKWTQHLYVAADPANQAHSLIHRAIKKYGQENFEFRIIQYLNTLKEALDAEKYWIQYYQTNVSKFKTTLGYNLTDGGDGTGGFKWSDESRKKFSNATLGENNNASILTDEIVINIKLLLLREFPIKEISKEFDVPVNYIQQIRRGKRWSHISESHNKEDMESIKRNGNAKINTDQAREIKTLLQKGNSVGDIVKILGISRWIVNGIKRGLSWKHIHV